MKYNKKLNNQGIAHVGLLVMVLLVIGVVGFAAYRVLGSKEQDDQKSTNDGSSQKTGQQEGVASDVTWMWGGEKWMPQGGTAPDCNGKPEFSVPASTAEITKVLYPGQQRSTGYKTHGGFLFENASNNEADVTIPIDSHLIKASRYIEMGEVQYFLVFSVPCGYVFRLDHLKTLTPKLQDIVSKLPEAKVDDSRTTSIQPAIAFKQGEKVATAVGFSKGPTGMDFGIYDVRQQNEISKNQDYAAKHQQEKEFAFYGVCFLDYMGANSGYLKSLPPADMNAGKTSDYCK